jgi:hypothetical protein
LKGKYKIPKNPKAFFYPDPDPKLIPKFCPNPDPDPEPKLNVNPSRWALVKAIIAPFDQRFMPLHKGMRTIYPTKSGWTETGGGDK